MIRSLRRRFLLIAMLSLLGTLAVLCTAIGLGAHYTATSRADRAITLLYENLPRRRLTTRQRPSGSTLPRRLPSRPAISSWN